MKFDLTERSPDPRGRSRNPQGLLRMKFDLPERSPDLRREEILDRLDHREKRENLQDCPEDRPRPHTGSQAISDRLKKSTRDLSHPLKAVIHITKVHTILMKWITKSRPSQSVQREREDRGRLQLQFLTWSPLTPKKTMR